MRNPRKHQPTHEIGALPRPDRRQDVRNAHQFFVRIDGTLEEGHVRGANGIRWRTA